MATEPDDELILDNEIDPENPDEDETREGDDDDSNVNDEDEEIPSFGDEGEDQEGDTGLVKHLRAEIKRARQEAAEARSTAKTAEPVVVGEKPTMASCDFDEAQFESELDAWKDRDRQAKQQSGQSEEAELAELAAWEEELNRVQREKLQLGAEDGDDAFDTVRSSLNTIQQAVLIKASENTGKLIYALGKNPDRLAEIAAIQDPLKLAVKIAKLEGQLKMVKRRKAPDPERIEKGSGKVSRETSDKTLEKLEKEAMANGGDRTKVAAYKAKLKAQKAK